MSEKGERQRFMWARSKKFQAESERKRAAIGIVEREGNRDQEQQ